MSIQWYNLATTVNSDEEIRLIKSEEEKVFIKNNLRF